MRESNLPTLTQYHWDTEWCLKVKKGQRTSRKTKQFELEGRIQSSVENSSARMHSVVAFLETGESRNELSQDWLILFRSCFPIQDGFTYSRCADLTRGDPIACAYVPVPIACFTILIPISISISIGRLLSWKSLSLSYWTYSFTTWIQNRHWPRKKGIDRGQVSQRLPASLRSIN